jgi:hypothetical protein
VLALLAGCASSPEAAPDVASDPGSSLPPTGAGPADSATAADTSTFEDVPLCEREATVTVRVDNKSSFDIRIAFGSYRPARLAEGFSRTNYQVARYLLRSDLRLEIIRGGLQIGPPAVIPTEPVFCNDATLVIGSRPEYSFYYGADWVTPKKEPADSSSNEASG